MAMKVLFTEGSSLTAREFLSVLGPAGHWIEVLDPSPACLCRFSRWTRKAIEDLAASKGCWHSIL